MEARRSRLERMQTLPNIKLISSSRGTILDSTPEIPSEDDAASGTPQRQQQRGPRGKTISFVKRMSEGRFFQSGTDRSPWRQTSSPIFRHLPHLSATTTTTTTTVTRGDVDQQLQAATPQSTADREQTDEAARLELNVADNFDSGGGGDGDVPGTDTNEAETTAQQTPADDEVDQLDQTEPAPPPPPPPPPQDSEELLSTVVTGQDESAEITPLVTTNI